MTVDACSRIQRSLMLVDRTDAPLAPTGGNCEGQDTRWWYPGFGAKKIDLENTKKAISLCQTCDVRLNCLKYALEWEAFGIWGGFTEKQRDSIRKRKGIMQQRKSLANSRGSAEYDISFKADDIRWLKRNGY